MLGKIELVDGFAYVNIAGRRIDLFVFRFLLRLVLFVVNVAFIIGAYFMLGSYWETHFYLVLAGFFGLLLLSDLGEYWIKKHYSNRPVPYSEEIAGNNKLNNTAC